MAIPSFVLQTEEKKKANSLISVLLAMVKHPLKNP
jgi:hypothetical protein